jgi:hypothetical protein
MSYPWMAALMGNASPPAATQSQLDAAEIAAARRRENEAFAAATSFEPVLAALFKTELEWRAQTRVEGKKVGSADELRAAIVALAKQTGWESKP